MKILILGTHGQKNIGDELLLHAFIERLRDGNEITVNSYDPKETAKNFGVKAFHTTRSKIRIMKEILNTEVILFAGGSILKEMYSGYGVFPYRVLIMILFLLLFSKVTSVKRKVIFSNIGVGPLPSSVGRILANIIIRLVDFISVRDNESYNYLVNTSIPSDKFKLVPDAVFGVSDIPKYSNLHENITSLKNVGSIGVNLGYYIEKQVYFEKLIGIIESLVLGIHEENPKIKFHGFVMQSGFMDANDYSVLTQIEKKVKKINSKVNFDVIVFEKPSELYEFLTNQDFIIASKLHANIISSIIGTPIIPIGYDVKVNAFAKMIGAEEYLIKIDETLTLENTRSRISKLFANFSSYKKSLRSESQKQFSEIDNYFPFLKKQLI